MNAYSGRVGGAAKATSNCIERSANLENVRKREREDEKTRVFSGGVIIVCVSEASLLCGFALVSVPKETDRDYKMYINYLNDYIDTIIKDDNYDARRRRRSLSVRTICYTFCDRANAHSVIGDVRLGIVCI